MKYYIIVYKNTHDAMEAEKILNNTGIKFRIMPTPTSITQSCGICTRFSSEKDIETIIEQELFEYKNIYIKDENEFSLLK